MGKQRRHERVNACDDARNLVRQNTGSGLTTVRTLQLPIGQECQETSCNQVAHGASGRYGDRICNVKGRTLSHQRSTTRRREMASVRDLGDDLICAGVQYPSVQIGGQSEGGGGSQADNVYCHVDQELIAAACDCCADDRSGGNGVSQNGGRGPVLIDDLDVGSLCGSRHPRYDDNCGTRRCAEKQSNAEDAATNDCYCSHRGPNDRPCSAVAGSTIAFQVQSGQRAMVTCSPSRRGECGSCYPGSTHVLHCRMALGCSGRAWICDLILPK